MFMLSQLSILDSGFVMATQMMIAKLFWKFKKFSFMFDQTKFESFPDAIEHYYTFKLR